MRKYGIALVYCGAVFSANLLAATFIPFPFFGMVAVGTLFFGATFTLRDYAHGYGRRFVYGMIACAAIINIIGAWLTTTPWRIIAASFMSILLSETADTEVYQRLLTRPWFHRVAGSNAVSIPLDTIIFTLIAFLGVLSWHDFMALMWGDMLLKWCIGLFVAGGVLFRKTCYV